jgi:hypothetical protein
VQKVIEAGVHASKSSKHSCMIPPAFHGSKLSTVRVFNEDGKG